MDKAGLRMAGSRTARSRMAAAVGHISIGAGCFPFEGRDMDKAGL